MKKALRKIITITMALMMVVGMDCSVFAFNGNSPFNSTTYKHNDRFSGNAVLNGVDVSTYQGGSKCNWTTDAMKNADFAILRVTWTGYTKSKHSYKNKDDAFSAHYAKAKGAGKLIGAYVFSQATNVNEAYNEASYAVSVLKANGIKPGDLNLPVYMDYEFAGPSSSGRLYGISKTTATQCAIAFCERIKALGYTPGIYANLSFLTNTVNGSVLGNYYDIWCAQYNTSCGFTGNYSKWQYSSSPYIDGMKNADGNKVKTDVNFWYINKSACPTSGTTLNVYGETNYLHTGKAITPHFDINYDGVQLREGVDYSIGYLDNTAVGQAYAYVAGTGAYCGEILIPYSIVAELPEEEPQEEVSEEVSEEIAEEPAQEPVAIPVFGKGLSRTVYGVPMSMKFSASSYYYDGGVKSPTLTVVQNGAVVASDTTSSNGTVNISYPSGRKLPGTYTARAYGYKAPSYADASFRIIVKPTTIKSLSKGKKAFTVKVAKQGKSYVTGYQVKYSRKSNMTAYKIKTIGSKYTTVKKKVTGCKKKSTFFVQVRSYKTISGKKYYSSWSAIKKIKTK